MTTQRYLAETQKRYDEGFADFSNQMTATMNSHSDKFKQSQLNYDNSFGSKIHSLDAAFENTMKKYDNALEDKLKIIGELQKKITENENTLKKITDDNSNKITYLTYKVFFTGLISIGSLCLAGYLWYTKPQTMKDIITNGNIILM